MLCPKCKGKVHVIDSVQNPETNEMYRRRKCLYCGYAFYTTETIMKFHDWKFKEKWDKFHRDGKKKKGDRR